MRYLSSQSTFALVAIMAACLSGCVIYPTPRTDPNDLPAHVLLEHGEEHKKVYLSSHKLYDYAKALICEESAAAKQGQPLRLPSVVSEDNAGDTDAKRKRHASAKAYIVSKNLKCVGDVELESIDSNASAWTGKGPLLDWLMPSRFGL